MTASVHLDWPGIRRRFGKTGGRDTMLQLVVTTVKAVPQAEEALRTAVARMAPRDGSRVVLATTPAPRGPVVTIAGGLEEEVLHSWLDELAAALQEAGVEGTVRPAPVRFPPDEPFDHETEHRGRAFPTAMAGFTMVDHPREGSADQLRFLVDPATMASLTSRFVAWGLQLPRAQVYAARVITSTVLGRQGLDDWLAASAEDTVGMTRLGFFVPLEVRARRLTLSGFGQAVLWDADANRPWPEAVADLRSWLTDDPAGLDQAHVRNAGIGMSDFLGLDSARYSPGHQPPSMSGSQFVGSRHLWDRYVVDAAGLQVLTRHHLDRANDLSGWTVTRLTDARYLVEAADLEPWFGQEAPDPGVLRAARAAFGDMILTAQQAGSAT